MALFLSLVLAVACSDSSAEMGLSVSGVYAEHRSDILDCINVCEFGGWYFYSVSVPAEGNGSIVHNRAKLEAMHRILLFIEEPALYKRRRGKALARKTDRAYYRNRLQVEVLERGPVRSSGEARYGITVGARPESGGVR